MRGRHLADDWLCNVGLAIEAILFFFVVVPLVVWGAMRRAGSHW